MEEKVFSRTKINVGEAQRKVGWRKVPEGGRIQERLVSLLQAPVSCMKLTSGHHPSSPTEIHVKLVKTLRLVILDLSHLFLKHPTDF